jgi:hypothetical protein
MGLRARWLKVVRPENGGPRARTVLIGLARTPRDRARAEELLDAMLASGELAMHGSKRGATYGLPKARTSNRAARENGGRAERGTP